MLSTLRGRASWAGLIVAAMLLVGAGSCSRHGATTRELMLVAAGWFTSIEESNFNYLPKYDVNAPDPRSPEFAAWRGDVEAVLQHYEQQKQAGTWQPDPTGYALVRAFKVGANPGTYWGAPGREGTPEEPVLIVRASFAYDEISEQHLPEGTIVFLQGYPLGRVWRVEIGSADKPVVDILDSVEMKLFMKHVPNHAEDEPAYKVVRAQLVEGSAKHRTVKWVF